MTDSNIGAAMTPSYDLVKRHPSIRTGPIAAYGAV